MGKSDGKIGLQQPLGSSNDAGMDILRTDLLPGDGLFAKQNISLNRNQLNQFDKWSMGRTQQSETN